MEDEAMQLKSKKLKLCNNNGGEEEEEEPSVEDDGGSWWEGLNPEILSLIFVRIPADELARTVPFVCQSWREVVAGPYCWSDIDVEQWCRRCNITDRIDYAVRKLVRRSKGTCVRLSAFKLGNAGFSFVANCVRCIKVLQIPMSEVTDKIVQKYAESLAMVTFLDISYCLNVTCKGLEVLGTNCKSLIHLRRNMPPPAWDDNLKAITSKLDNREAMIIADTMPRLQHLELAYGRFDDTGLEAILTNCKDLIHLDVQGCPGVMMKGDHLWDKCEQLKVFKSPWDDQYSDANSSDSDGNDIPESESEEFSSESDEEGA